MQNFINKQKISSLDDGSTVVIKRGCTTGFTKENVQERIKMMQKTCLKVTGGGLVTRTLYILS